MEKFIRGDIVVVPFPFSDLSESKKRPALVIANLKGDDVILTQITSQNVKDIYAIPLNPQDIESGKLKQISNIRPNRIFTADKNIILYKIAHLKMEKMDEVRNKIIEIINE